MRLLLALVVDPSPGVAVRLGGLCRLVVGRASRASWSIASTVLIGLAVLANGAALVVYIVRAIPLPVGLTGFWAAGLLAIGFVLIRSVPDERRLLVRTFVVGAIAGLVATGIYDIAKAGFSLLDPVPWNPFEATRLFGVAIVGPAGSDAMVRAAGWAFHFSNGTTFGVAFAFMFGRWALLGPIRAIAIGVAWGLFLETFQLVLFPGWMSIRFVDEFRQVSFNAHLVFGAVLGLLVPAGIRGAGVEGWR